jgi:hypothetical protein
MKLKRGQKLCKNCNGINGARSHVCKHCNSEFIKKENGDVVTKTKRRKKRFKKFSTIENWQELTSGELIKVVRGYGSYYVNGDGEKQYLADGGVYSIISVDTKGLVVHGRDGGFGYIYMGPEEKSETLPNVYRSPHKIIKVNSTHKEQTV